MSVGDRLYMVHTLRRIKERYGVELTPKHYGHLCNDAKRAQTLEVQPDGTHLRVVPFWNRKEKQIERMVVVFDTKAEMIKTALPRDVVQLSSYRALIYKVGK